MRTAKPTPVVLHNPGRSLPIKTLDFTLSGRGRSQRTLVTTDLIDLVSALTSASVEHRCEYARHLLLQAKQTHRDAAVHHLYSSIERDGWDAYRQKCVKAVEQDRAVPSALLERQMLASEIRSMTHAITDMLGSSMRTGAEPPDTLAPTPKEPEERPTIGDTSLLTATLRSGRQQTQPRPARADAAKSGGALRGTHLGSGGTQAEHATVLLVTPRWEPGPEVGRLQATVRFRSPGISHGQPVALVGPDGGHLALEVPVGMRHVQRLIASVSASATGAERKPRHMRLDIITLPRESNQSSIEVEGEEGRFKLWLPPFAVPATSLVVAFPCTAGSSSGGPLFSSRPERQPQRPKQPPQFENGDAGGADVSATSVVQAAGAAPAASALVPSPQPPRGYCAPSAAPAAAPPGAQRIFGAPQATAAAAPAAEAARVASRPAESLPSSPALLRTASLASATGVPVFLSAPLRGQSGGSPVQSEPSIEEDESWEQSGALEESQSGDQWERSDVWEASNEFTTTGS